MNEKNLYNILITAKKCRTIGEIANRLYLSQPYISKLLKQSEKKYDTILIQRSPIPISLTQAGETLLKNLEKVITTRDELEQAMMPYRQSQQSYLKIACEQPWLANMGPKIISEIQKKYPNITFELLEDTVNNAAYRLKTNQINIFLGKSFQDPNIRCLQVFQEKFCLIIPKQSDLFQFGQQVRTADSGDLLKLNGENFIGRVDGTLLQNLIDQMFDRLDIKVKNIAKVIDSFSVTQMAKEGQGDAITFESLAKPLFDNKNLNVYRLPPDMIPFDLSVLYKKRSSKEINEVAKSLVEIVTNLN